MIFACAFVYMTTPNKFRWFDLPAVYCHRGCYGDGIPENSLAAFRKSSELELAVELDVRPTSDGQIVVFHDENVLRMCGVDKNVRDMSFDELSQLRLDGTEEQIPLFSAALEACAGVPIYCEIKTDTTDVDEAFMKNVYDLIKTYDGQIVVVSFNPFVLGWFKKNHPDLIRGQLSQRFDKIEGVSPLVTWALSNLLTNCIAKPDFVSYRFTDKTFGMILCRLYGTRMVGWTVHSMEDVETAAYHGYSTFVGEHFDMTEV